MDQYTRSQQELRRISERVYRGSNIHIGIDSAIIGNDPTVLTVWRPKRNHEHLVLDYPQIVPLKERELFDLSQRIKALAKNFNIPVITGKAVHNSNDEVRDALLLCGINDDTKIYPHELSSQDAYKHCFKCKFLKPHDVYSSKYQCTHLFTGSWLITTNTIKKCDSCNFKEMTVDPVGLALLELLQSTIKQQEKQTMTAEQTIKVLEAMRAGKKILVSGDGRTWTELKYDPKHIELNTQQYQYKLAPTFREFRGNELEGLMCERIKNKSSPTFIAMIIAVETLENKVFFNGSWHTTKEVLEHWTQRNGLPFGVEIE